MEPWRYVLREGYLPLLTDPELEALRKAVQGNDPRLIQGKTVAASAWSWLFGSEVGGACLLTYPGWQCDGLWLTSQVENRFQEISVRINCALGLFDAGPLGHPGKHVWASSALVAYWYDATPREEVFRELLPEINREQARRAGWPVDALGAVQPLPEGELVGAAEG